MPKAQINIRASALTAQRLAELKQKSGMSTTEIVSVAIDRMHREEIGMDTNRDLVNDYAVTCAEAYRDQYLGDHEIMNQPRISYNLKTKIFGWGSSLTPLSENEVEIEKIEEGDYGETGDDADAAYHAIIEYLSQTTSAKTLLDKISAAKEH